MKNKILILFLIISNYCFAQAKIENKKTDKDSLIYNSVEEMPIFPGGEAGLYKYLSKKIKYPKYERKNEISGTVYVSFVINTKGKAQNVTIVRGIKGGEGLDKEAMRVIKKMPNWSVGKQNGKPVLVQFTLPIKFILR